MNDSTQPVARTSERPSRWIFSWRPVLSVALLIGVVAVPFLLGAADRGQESALLSAILTGNLLFWPVEYR